MSSSSNACSSESNNDNDEEEETCNDGPKRGFNESLIVGFALLRCAQLIAFNVYYCGALFDKYSKRYFSKDALICNDLESAIQKSPNSSGSANSGKKELAKSKRGKEQSPVDQRQQLLDRKPSLTILDELSGYNPFQKHVDSSVWLGSFVDFLKILLSFSAIVIATDRLITTVFITAINNALNSHDSAINDQTMQEVNNSSSMHIATIATTAATTMTTTTTPTTTTLATTLLIEEAHIATNASLTSTPLLPTLNLSHAELNLDAVHHSTHEHALANHSQTFESELQTGMVTFIVLMLYQISELIILTDTIFRGHLIWNLLSQRLFLVSRKYQIKTMLFLLVFAYCDYFLYICFVENLFQVTSKPLVTTNNRVISSQGLSPSIALLIGHKPPSIQEHTTAGSESASVLLLFLSDILYFSRTIIRIGPYISMNYAIACLCEHIGNIRNQQLFIESLNKRHKSRLAVPQEKLQRQSAKVRLRNSTLTPFTAATATNSKRGDSVASSFLSPSMSSARASYSSVSDAVGARTSLSHLQLLDVDPLQYQQQSAKVTPTTSSNRQSLATNNTASNSQAVYITEKASELAMQRGAEFALLKKRKQFCDRITNFDELETYVTDLYVFAGRLNSLISRQGLVFYFIVHSLIISSMLLAPEKIGGSLVSIYILYAIVIVLGLLPFYFGYCLDEQLVELSKQIDRIIVHHQFIYRRRENLVRIRELISDIKISCGGMLHFNIKSGIKFLIVSSATAFFIKQEHYKLTQRSH